MNFPRLLVLAIAMAFVLPADAGGKKNKDAIIAFHMETDPGDNHTMIFTQFVAGKERVFRRMPEVGTKDIESFNPFPSQDGEGFGIVFKVKTAAKHRLAAVTANSSGRWFIARINGRIVDGVIVDQQINDGELVVWKGVSLAEVNELDQRFPRFGAKKPRG
ncbi:hypothetical protein [Haloferula sp.]|uniref:hypothetical protein n=1 Tax=Haloferula sp. TaxID=2497595 RepID=UPI003C752F1D